MFGSKSNYDSHFFVDGEQISGVTSVDISYNNSATITNPLGYHKGLVSVGGPTQQTVSVSRYLMCNTPLDSLATQGQNFSGSLNYEGASYGFQSGYMVSSSVNCAVGSMPRSNYSLVVYDELRSGANASGTNTSDIHIPSQGSISITADNVTSNRVLGFDYSQQFKYKPYYTIGSETPVDVKYISPTIYNASVQLEVDDAMPESGYTFLTSGKNGGRLITLVVDGKDGVNIQSYTVPNAVLTSEQLSATADGSLRLTLNYVGHQ
tara:strand:+ start:650 stop:1441 length:792 start_codon:yes stop_codon:yes gene_type:complete